MHRTRIGEGARTGASTIGAGCQNWNRVIEAEAAGLEQTKRLSTRKHLGQLHSNAVPRPHDAEGVAVTHAYVSRI